MLFFNGTVVTKKLQNVIDTFIGKLKMNRGFIHLDSLILPQIMRQNARRYFSHHSKMYFPVQKKNPIETWEKLSFISFKE